MKKITILFLVLSLSICSFSQVTIRGIVSADSIPLESASVIIKNTKKGVATNEKGQFKVEAKKGDTLSVSYIGYKTKDVIVDENENLSINLEEGNKLDEVLVIGYSNYTKCSWTRCYGILEVIDEKSTSTQVKLFPNPSSDGIFQLKLNEDYEEVKIMVSNLSGQTIQNSVHQKFGNKLNIDLSEFATGIYIVNIIADGKPLKAIKAVRS